ncbi:hypothetical protein CBER1_05763 [Cercospora berteroae]|uniref:BTB domain-containing protein n=1 Tax=Cercospora berteroae TaxID=357750 RepID=A0A2S6CHZ4_9PEZI|nr:hypothetical protein CBER1_05763 [Cercospora berteroae]
MEQSDRVNQTLREIAKKYVELAGQSEELAAQATALNAEGDSMMENFERMKDEMGVIELEMWLEMYSELRDKKREIVASMERHGVEMDELVTQHKNYFEASKKQGKDTVTASGGPAGVANDLEQWLGSDDTTECLSARTTQQWVHCGSFNDSNRRIADSSCSRRVALSSSLMDDFVHVKEGLTLELNAGEFSAPASLHCTVSRYKHLVTNILAPMNHSNTHRTSFGANTMADSGTGLLAADGDVILVVGPAKKCIRVCSVTLSRASSVFAALCGPQYREGQQARSSSAPADIARPDDNADDFRFVCRVLHFHAPNLEDRGLENEAKKLLGPAIVVDKYALTTASVHTSRDLPLIGKSEYTITDHIGKLRAIDDVYKYGEGYSELCQGCDNAIPDYQFEDIATEAEEKSTGFCLMCVRSNANVLEECKGQH